MYPVGFQAVTWFTTTVFKPGAAFASLPASSSIAPFPIGINGLVCSLRLWKGWFMMGLRISRTIAGGILALVLLSPTVAAAGPVTIVDTGQGTSTWAALVGIRPAGGGLPEAEQWLAGEFLVASPVTITSIEGWMYVDQSGQLAVKVYSDGGDAPGSELFGSAFSVTQDWQAVWVGATGLSWALDPGAYWVAFQSYDPSVGAYMPGEAPSPLVNEAYIYDFTGSWLGGDHLDLGFRILGESPNETVPDPGFSVILLGIGLVGLRACRRRWQ